MRTCPVYLSTADNEYGAEARVRFRAHRLINRTARIPSFVNAAIRDTETRRQAVRFIKNHARAVKEALRHLETLRVIHAHRLTSDVEISAMTRRMSELNINDDDDDLMDWSAG